MARALGRYELLRPLARGGMAEVFLARRRAAGVEKWLVVKRMRPERSGDVRFLDLFVREARLSMSLAHQNIVPVFDFGRIDDQVFLAMERVEGRDLGSSLARARGPMPPLLAAFVAAECCQALDYAHHRRGPDGVALGIVHRDVTPRNVLLSWSGEVKLTDFGIAALAGDATIRVLGTPAYMAPEQARGEPLDARADVYAIGLVLREALTGVRARAGDDRESMLAAARRGELTAWACAGALADIVARATSADVAARFPDARSMLEAIDAFIVGDRADHRGDAPARQLASWLAKIWEDDRETTDLGDGDGVDAEHLLSFLDDGALGVIGTGTERSMAATAADVPIADAPIADADADAAPETGERRAEGGERNRTADAVPVPVAVRRRWLAALGLVAAMALVLAIGIGLGGTRRSTAPTAIIDAATAVNVVPPPSPPPPLTNTAIDAGSDPPPPPPTSPPPPKLIPHDKHIAAIPPPPPPSPPDALIRRNVTINARPWANFTIDDDPTPHQTVETLALPVGPHHVHFSNPQLHVERDVTIDVPADRDLKFVEPLQ